jgi:hypothetical protein
MHMPIGRAERIAMETRRTQQIEQGYRSRRWFLFRVGVIYLLWLIAGCVMMGWSFRVRSVRYANLLFELSFAVGYGGMFFTAIAAYVRGRERGEWD